MRIKKLPIFVCLIGSLAIGGNSLALPPLGGFLPGPAQSQQVSKALQSQTPQPVQSVPQAATAPAVSHPEIPEAMKKIKFKLEGVILTGNHVYSTAVLEHFYKDKLHKTISVADIFIILEMEKNSRHLF